MQSIKQNNVQVLRKSLLGNGKGHVQAKLIMCTSDTHSDFGNYDHID